MANIYITVTEEVATKVTYPAAQGPVGPPGPTGDTGPAGGVTTLSGLSDTPNIYEDGKYLRSTASGTEWTTASGVGITDHSDLNELDYASSGHTGFAKSGAGDINAQTGTTYTFVLTDASKLVTFGNAGAITVTIPTNASVAFPISTQIDCIQILAGKVTFGGAGVTINSKDGNKAINGQWVGATLIKTATDVWSLLGDLIA